MKKQISILSAMCLALLSGGAASAFANSATQPQLDAVMTKFMQVHAGSKI